MGGTGDEIAKGTPEGKLGATGKGWGEKPKPRTETIRIRPNPMLAVNPIALSADASRPLEGRERFMQRIGRDGFLPLLEADPLRPADSREPTLDSVVGAGGKGNGDIGPLGLPDGTGTGNTRAGFPTGTDRSNGAKLWLYRVKYDGNWDANPTALPALLKEVHKATNVPVASSQETMTLRDLPNHTGKFFPRVLFITGTGRIDATDVERANLRKYLEAGGMLVADSSGGEFERAFADFIGRVLPKQRLRAIELDHEIYRGSQMIYQLPGGCPIYRQHGSADARGVFDDDGRLMVFLSPGDLGSAWSIVDLGRKRGQVEQAFQMGTNLVVYAHMEHPKGK